MMKKIVQQLVLVVGSLGLVYLANAITHSSSADHEIRTILGDPGAIERFAAARAARNRISSSVRSTHPSPLEQEAAAFAKLLNPPTEETECVGHHVTEAVLESVPVPPQIKLLGTCVNTENPTQSCALIEDHRNKAEGEDSLDNGPRWIRLNRRNQGLTVTLIENDRIVVQTEVENWNTQ